MTRTQQELRDVARRGGFDFDTYSPGDGVTRYRFFPDPGHDYFSGDGDYTALGYAEAMAYARGRLTGAGYATREALGKIDRVLGQAAEAGHTCDYLKRIARFTLSFGRFS
jgi:hypothetical protein